MIIISCCLLIALGVVIGQVTNCQTSFSALSGNSNLGGIPVGAYESTVRAGVPYNPSVIDTCTDALATGSGTASISARLIPLGSDVCPPSGPSIISSVFDGNTSPDRVDSTMIRWSSSQNTVSFPNGGQFTLCYFSSFYATLSLPPYAILPLIITVQGISDVPYKIFCLASNAIPCSAYLEGYGLPGDGSWKLAPTLYTSSACGSSTLMRPFSQTSTAATVTTSTSGYEIHDFGLRNLTLSPASYKACYCAGYQATARGDNSYCNTDSSSGYSNFLQNVGNIIMMSLSVTDSRSGSFVSVYPRMRVNLQIVCGTGGCSSNTSPRIKIVESNIGANAKPYYDETAGCRFALQSSRYMSPTNCDPSTFDCNLERSDLATATDPSLAPTWKDVKLDSELFNNVRINRYFDVCYCDSDCSDESGGTNWFFVATIDVIALQVRFWSPVDGITLYSTLDVNTPTILEIFGNSNGPFASSGSFTREMKLVQDNDLSMSSDDCATPQQPSEYVSGHNCYSASDCESPYLTGTSSLKYGPLTVSKPGWWSVCYCNELCSTVSNWLLIGRTLVPGPSGTDEWHVTLSESFSLQISGYGLASQNIVKIIPSDTTCNQLGTFQTSQPAFMYGPTVAVATVAGGASITAITDSITAGLGYLPVTVISFAAPHNLVAGDWIQLTGVVTNDARNDPLFNTNLHIQSIVDETIVTIPVAFESGDSPLWINVASAVWWKSDTQIFSALVSEDVGSYSVCWLPASNSPLSSAVFAGTLIVNAPPMFSSGSIALATSISSVPTPAFIRFTTSGSPSYGLIRSNPVVRVVFEDITKIFPLNALDSTTLNLVTLPSTLDTARPDICSLFILEASCQLPAKCFVSLESITGQSRLDINIVFELNNGFVSNTEYTFSMLVEGASGWGSDGTSGIHILAMDDLVNVSPYAVIEKIPLVPVGTSSLAPLASGSPNIVPSIASVSSTYPTGTVRRITNFCASEGPIAAKQCIACVDETDCGGTGSTTNWCVSSTPCAPVSSTSPQFTFDLVNTGSSPLVGGSTISILISPLVQFGENIFVSCESSNVLKSCASDSLQITVSSIFGSLDTDNNNLIIITLPLTMSPLESGGDTYTYSIGGIPVPKNGVQNGIIYFQISDPDGVGLGFSSSNGWVIGSPNFASAELLTADGNENPFTNSAGNIIYLKFVPGFIVGPNTAITVNMPSGYVCREYPVAGCTGDEVYCDFPNIVPSNISEFQDSINNMGSKSQIGARIAGWDNVVWFWSGAGTNTCTLNLGPSTTLFSPIHPIYIALIIDNPSSSLKRSNEVDNVWHLSASWNDVVSSTLLSSSEVKKFSNNLAVIGTLTNQLIVPSSFAYGNLTNNMYVFFKTESSVCVDENSLSAEIWVDAPPGFDFGQSCVVSQLDANIYNVLEGDSNGEITLPLPTPLDESFLDSITCTGVATVEVSSTISYNRAMIRMARGGGLIGPSTYGFRLLVHNPSTNPTLGNNVWNITTFENFSSQCDGSQTTIPMILSDSLSWNLYSADMTTPSAMTVSIASMHPYAGTTTLVSVGPFYVSTQTASDFRITAPVGYIWDFNPINFQYKTASDGGQPTPTQVIQAFRPTLSLPLSYLPVAPVSPTPLNVLEFRVLNYPLFVGKTYGFAAGIRVPRRTPTTGPNVFIIEFGYNAVTPNLRTEAAVVSAPLVQSVINGQYDDSSMIVGELNSVCLGFVTVSTIPRGGAIRVVPPPSFGYTFPGAPTCVPRPWNDLYGSLPPVDSVCTVTTDDTIDIVAGPSGISAGTYQFCFQVLNPSTDSGGVRGIWEVETLSIAAVDGSLLDYSTSITGSIVALPFTASLVGISNTVPNESCRQLTSPSPSCSPYDIAYWATNRNDRPYQLNSLIFQLVAPTSASSLSSSSILIRGPAGFVFEYFCEYTITDVLGEGVAYPPLFSSSPVPVTQCRGQGRYATLTLSAPLSLGTRYLIGLKVINPASTPSANYWTITYNEFGSARSEGFSVWALENTESVPTNFAANEVNIVQISFSPSNQVPIGGFLAVVAPTGFTIDTTCTSVITLGGTTEVIPSVCAGTATPSNTATISLTTTALLGGGVSYMVALSVNNPSATTTTTSVGEWSVSSFSTDSESGILDSTSIPGFQITTKIDLFSILDATSQSGTEPVTYTMEFALPITAEPGDSLQVRFPAGFVLNGYGKRSCQGFTLLTYNGAAPPPTLSGISPVCGGNLLVLTLASQSTITSGSVVVFLVNSVNPPTQPDPNVFLLTQYSNQLGSVVASRLITGLDLYPKLVSSSIVFANIPPIAGASSWTNLNISFIPMSSANLLKIEGANSVFATMFAAFSAATKGVQMFDYLVTTTRINLSIVSLSEGAITFGQLQLEPATRAYLYISGVKNPSIDGHTEWHLTTYQESVGNKKDEVWNVAGPEILGEITLITSLCSISPNVYKSERSRAIFALSSSIDIESGSVLVITPPRGFSLIKNSFIEVLGVYFTLSGTRGTSMWLVVDTLIRANTNSFFAVSTTTPPEVDSTSSPNWYIDFFSNTEQTNRIATNDNLFPGFDLIGIMPFHLSPENYAPSTAINLEIDYRLPNEIVGINSVGVSVMAPIGFIFAPSCLVSSSSISSPIPIFESCRGTNNVANLTTYSNVLASGSGTFRLALSTSPTTTPADNSWTLGAVIDEFPNVFSNMDHSEGYTITSLLAKFVGGNRLAAQTVAFFSFSLSRTVSVSSTFIRVVITPDSDSGYTLVCSPIFQVGMPSVPKCTVEPLDSSVSIEVPVSLSDSVQLSAGQKFCVGVAINNPALPVLSTANFFSLVVIDPSSGTTIDANTKVSGTTLKSTQISGCKLRFQSAIKNSLTLVEIEFEADKPLMSSTITDGYVLKIFAPENFIISAASSVQTTSSLALAKNLPIIVTGNLLSIVLDTGAITPQGTYVIQFPVMNPGTVPVENYWLVQLYFQSNLLYNAPIAGYQLSDNPSSTR